MAIGAAGTLHYSGSAPLSERERLVEPDRQRGPQMPDQGRGGTALDVVDESGGSVAVERRFARLMGLRLGRLPRYPGSATG
jgi:hypothetical protein